MDAFFNCYMWYFPLLAIFEYILINKKRIFAAENGKLSSPIDEEKANDYRVSIFFAIIVFLPMILIVGFRDQWFADTALYVKTYLSIPEDINDFSTFLVDEKEPGFRIFTYIIKLFVHDNFQIWLLIISIIQFMCLLLTYRRYTSEIVACAFFFFASTDMWSWSMNGMRQFLVATIIFALTPLLISGKSRNIIVFVALVLLLTTFHQSCLIVIPLYLAALGKPFNKKTVSVLILCVLAVVFINQFTSIMDLALEDSNYSQVTTQMLEDDGVNPFRALFYSIPAILAIIFKNRFNENTPKIISVSVNMSLITMGLYLVAMVTSGIYIGRLPIYFSLFNYILLPWEINNFFKNNKLITAFVIVLIYIVFFVFQMMTWDMI